MASNMNLEFQLSILTAMGIKNLQDMDNFLKTLRNTLLTVQTQAERTQVALSIKDFTTIRSAMAGVAGSVKNLGGASSNASMALLNLNYVIRDSPYFFNNFAMGLLAVGNNLNPLIDSFARLKKDAIDQNISAFGLLKKAMVGGAGISIAFSVVVTAIQAVVFQMSKNKTATESLADSIKKLWSDTYKATKQWNEFTDALSDMSLLDLQESLRALNEEIEDHNIGLEEWLFNIDSITSAIVLNLSVGLDMAIKKMAEYIRKRDEIAGTIKGKGTTGWVNQLKEEIKQLEEERGLLPVGTGQNIYDYYNNSIKETQILLDKLIGKTKEEKKAREEITGQIYKQAKAMQVLMNVASGGVYEGSDIMNLRGRGVQPEKNKPYASFFGGASGERMKESMKEFQVQLELAKIASQELGQFLAEAFYKGKFAVDAFIASLIQAISQMLILKAITSAFSFAGGGAASAMGSSPALSGSGSFIGPRLPGGMIGKVAVVGGEITMDSNKFIVKLSEAQTAYNSNYGVNRGISFNT